VARYKTLYNQERIHLATGGLNIKRWSKFVWACTVTPRHAFIMWMTMHDKLPVKSKLVRFTDKIEDQTCVLCNAEAEDVDHLLFQCIWAKAMWQAIRNGWPIPLDISGKATFARSLIKLRKSKDEKQITYSIVAAVIYNIWRARNK